MEKITIKILEQVKTGKLPIKLAQEQLFNLFGVSKPLRDDFGKPPKTDAEWDKMCNRIANENK